MTLNKSPEIEFELVRKLKSYNWDIKYSELVQHINLISDNKTKLL